MPTKYANASGELVDEAAPGAKFPIYFCEGCGFRGAAFGIARADVRLSYCGWEDGRPVCVGKGRADAPAQP